MNSKTYYMILVRYTSLSLTTWVPYIGEITGVFDWWNGMPKRFTTLEDAEKKLLQVLNLILYLKIGSMNGVL